MSKLTNTNTLIYLCLSHNETCVYHTMKTTQPCWWVLPGAEEAAPVEWLSLEGEPGARTHWRVPAPWLDLYCLCAMLGYGFSLTVNAQPKSSLLKRPRMPQDLSYGVYSLCRKRKLNMRKSQFVHSCKSLFFFFFKDVEPKHVEIMQQCRKRIKSSQ